MPSPFDWLFSAKTFLAAMLALYIALWMDLPRPYWAVAAVYITSNPLAGATISKGVYRALGTVLGASATVFLVPPLIDAPELLALAVALWTGALLHLSLLDRTPRSYLFMLAGYTLPLIAFPAVSAPETIFDIALARCEEIILGITCASLVNLLVFPTSVGTALDASISAWFNDTARWASDILEGDGALPTAPIQRQKLATNIASLDRIQNQLFYDADTRDIARYVSALRARLLMMLPLLSSLGDRLHALRLDDQPLPENLTGVLGETAALFQQRDDRPRWDQVDGIKAHIRALEPASAETGWRSLMLSSALARLRETTEVWQNSLQLRAAIAARRQPERQRPAVEDRHIVGNARHHDHGLIVFASMSTTVAMLVSSTIWIATGWEDGATFVTWTAIACSFFATMDQPAPSMVSMFIFVAVGIVVAFVYLFAILPGISGFEMLAAALAPALLFLGVLIPQPRLSVPAVLVAIDLAGFVALQDRFSADFMSFANEAIATQFGIGFAFAWTTVTRPFGAEVAARRLIRAGWKELAETAEGPNHREYSILSGHVLDRLGQLVPRLAYLDDEHPSEIDGLAELRVGFNILVIQRQLERLGGEKAAALDAVLAGVAALFRERVAKSAAVQPSNRLLDMVDRALIACGVDTGPRDRELLDAIVGLRRALFPYVGAPETPTHSAPPLAVAE